MALILEEKQYSYQVALSDIAGSDIEAHEGRFDIAVRKVRNWLAGMQDFERIGADRVLKDYYDFQAWYLNKQRAKGFSDDDVRDYSTAELLKGMNEWHQLNPIAH